MCCLHIFHCEIWVIRKNWSLWMNRESIEKVSPSMIIELINNLHPQSRIFISTHGGQFTPVKLGTVLIFPTSAESSASRIPVVRTAENLSRLKPHHSFATSCSCWWWFVWPVFPANYFHKEHCAYYFYTEHFTRLTVWDGLRQSRCCQFF